MTHRLLVFRPQAEWDLDNITRYLEKELGWARTAEFIDDIQAHTQTLVEFPNRYPLRPDLLPGIRVALHGDYLIFYSVETDQIIIERILHGARDYQTLFG